VVLDCGNGVAALTAPRAFEDAGCIVSPLYCEVDGTFPNHHPDPTVMENLEDMKERVLETGADIGIAFDGDGDRIGVVDERAQVIYGDKILLYLARDLLSRHPGATVIGEVKCSHILYDDIAKHGGRPVMWKTGHSLIKQKMKETGALLAGEMSGHIFFADRFFGFDDATYAALRVAEILSRSDRPLSSYFSDLPRTWSTPEIRVECPEEFKFQIVDRARKWFADRYDTIDVDGLRIVFPDGWGLIRASNTQPVLVLRFEADSPERLEEIRGLVEGRLKEIRDEVEKAR
jgi:phosphomannomutase/phosphoglucomutase